MYVYRKHALQWRFLLAGGFNTLVAIAMFPLLYSVLEPLRSHYNMLLVLSHVICMTTAFCVHKYGVFKSQGIGFWEYLRFTMYYNVIFIINLALLPVLVQGLQISPAYIQLGINVVIAVISYFWHRHVTFKVSAS